MTAIVLHDLGSRREARAWFATPPPTPPVNPATGSCTHG